MNRPLLSFNSRKSLCNHLGEEAGNEIADLIQRLTTRIEHLERNKVDITPIVPGVATPTENSFQSDFR